MDFYCHSNTHDPDQDGFEDLYCRDFIHAISHVARRKLACHHLDPYQHAAFRRGIVHHNTGEEEVNPTLELAMEYTGALGTIIFDESCHLPDLTEAQVGRNQFAIDIAVDRLDREVDHAAEHIGALEDKEANTECSLNVLLELGREQTEASTHAACGLGQLATCVLAQQNKIRAMEERMDAMREMILGLEHMAVNPIVVNEEEMVVEAGSSSGEELEVEENEVVVPILVPGRLVPIKECCPTSWSAPRSPSSWLRKTVLLRTSRYFLSLFPYDVIEDNSQCIWKKDKECVRMNVKIYG